MAEQNVAYSSQDTILESLILHTIPSFGAHGDGIINQNLLLAYLKGKGSKSFKVKDGGLELWKGVRTRQSSNFKWQGKSDTMTTNEQDPNQRMRFDWKTFTGSVVLNALDKARNKGRAAIKDFALELREQASDTIMNQFNSAFWNAGTLGDDEPQSVPSLISITPTSGTIGGVTRSTAKAFQNGAVTTTITDIGSETGIKEMKKAQIRQTIRANDKVDLIIMDEDNYSGLVGYLATQNRFMPNDKLAQLDIEAIKLGTTTIGFENRLLTDDTENTITDGYVYGINSNHMAFEVLKDGNFMWNPDGFERVGGTLNKALYFWVFCNLTTNLPKAHFVMTDVSNA